MNKENLPRLVPLGEKKRRELDRYLESSSTRSLIIRFMILQITALEKLKYEKEVGKFASWPGITAEEIHNLISRTFHVKVSVHTVYRHLNNMRHLFWIQGVAKNGSDVQPLPGWALYNSLTSDGEEELERITYLLGRKKKLPSVRPDNPYGNLLSLTHAARLIDAHEAQRRTSTNG